MYCQEKNSQTFAFFCWQNNRILLSFFICHIFSFFIYFILFFFFRLMQLIVSLCLALCRVSNDEKWVADNCREYLADGQTNRLLDCLPGVLTYRVYTGRKRDRRLDHVLLDRAFIISIVVSTTITWNNSLWNRKILIFKEITWNFDIVNIRDVYLLLAFRK